MKWFWNVLTSAWWGIALLFVACMALWILVSAVLYRQFFKRFYDFILSLLAIIVLSPLLIVLTVTGAAVMRGNPFFTQLRPGKKEKLFKLVKFRTMTSARDKRGELLPDDERLTEYGKFLRSSSLDELPELFNILVGQMSIVGPRPLLIRDVAFMDDEQRKRHSVRQGLTGLAQVNGRNSIGWDDKLNYDMKYVEKITLRRDVAILFKTIIKVFARADINRNGTVSDLDYGDWLLAEKKITREEYDLILKDVSNAR